MTIRDALLPEFDQEMVNTRKLLARVPDDKFSWKPHEKSMTLGHLASHVAEMPFWAVPTIDQDSHEIAPDWKPYIAASTAELLDHFDKNIAAARAAIAGTSDEALAKNWKLIFGGHPVFSQSKAEVLRGIVMNHLIHHRGQLTVYLRLLDVPIPGMYGPSADEGM